MTFPLPRVFFQDVLAVGLLVFLGLVVLLDQDVGIALSMVSALGAATLFALRKLGVRQQELYLLFAGVLVVHVLFALFVHYAAFQPFGGGIDGGDFVRYNASAQEFAERIRSLNFSQEGLNFSGLTHFPMIVGFVYVFTLPAMVVGQLFTVWVAALAVIVLYFLALEIGVSRAWAFTVALLAALYPTFFFLTAYVMKEGIIVLCVLLSLLLLVRLLKRFSWGAYAVMFAVALPLANLRTEIYDVFAITFFICWFVSAAMPIKRRVLVGIVMFVLYGFVPLLATPHGYYNMKYFREHVNVNTAIALKENAYLPVIPTHPPVASQAPAPSPPASLPPIRSKTPEPKEEAEEIEETEEKIPAGVILQRGRTSTVENLAVGAESTRSFLWNQTRALAFVVLGPFPWQFQTSKHYAALTESIPWLLLFPVVLLGMWNTFRKNKRSPAFALALFSLLVFGLVAFFINNFGITMRIRIPAVLALLPFVAFAFPLGIPYTISRIKSLMARA